MGIKNLKKFIRDKFPNEIQKSNLNNFYGQIFTMDIMSYIYKSKISLGDNWLNSIINLIKLFKKFNIHVNIIFEGDSPIEKSKEKENRRKQRKLQEERIICLKKDFEIYHSTGIVSSLLKDVCENVDKNDKDKIDKLLHFNSNTIEKKNDIEYLSDHMINLINQFIHKKEKQIVNISDRDIEKIKNICDMFRIPYLQSQNEAETLCCKLSENVNFHKNSIGVISEDTDILAYGTKILLCDLNISNGDCNILYLPSILESMKITYNSFLNFCVLSGTDYNTNIPGYGSVKCYELILKYNSIENIFENEFTNINKKVNETIEKKKKKLEESNLKKIETDIWDEIQEENSYADISTEIIKRDMLHSISMFSLKISMSELKVNYWDSNVNIENLFENCLRYNVNFNCLQNLWKNNIKLIQ